MFFERSRILVCCAGLFLLCSLCFGQGNTANIVGLVTDPSGAIVPSAAITLNNTQTGVVSNTASNGAGEYNFPFLPPGTYTISVKAPGFQTFTRAAFILELNRELRVDTTLQPGSPAQTVEVTGQAPLLDTETSAISTTVGSEALRNLPLPGRDPQQVQLLVPGVVQNSQGQFVNGGGIMFHTAYYVDGTPNNNHVWSGNPISPNPDTIQEFTAVTNNLSAEYGNTGGMILLSTIKSGTNQFHGTLFEFFQNDKLNAGNYYNHSLNQQRFNRFGGTLGGPIIKNKTFFFVDADIQRQHGAQFFNNLTVPTAAFKQGDFSSVLGSQIGTDVLGRAVYQNEIFNPFTQRQVTDPSTGKLVWVRDPFPGNRIPQQLLSPAALKLQALFPDPQTSTLTQNFSAAGLGGQNTYQWDVKVDHNFTEKNRLSARFSHSYADNFSAQPFPNPLAGNAFPSSYFPNYQVSISDVHTFSPSMVNQLILSWSQQYGNRGSAGFGQVGAATFGINGFPFGDQPNGTPIINFGGASGVSPLGSPSGSLYVELDKDESIYDNFTIIRGRHTIKTGGMWRRLANNNFQPSAQTGNWTFDNLFTNQQQGTLAGNTGFDYASFLLGLPANMTFSIMPDFSRVSNPIGGAFVQDDFRVNDRLTLNLGFRWDNWYWPHEAQNRSGFFNLQTLQFQRFGTNGYRTSLYEQSSGIFGPRLGVAYRPWRSSNTVIRAGFGIIAMGNQGIGGQSLIPLSPFFQGSDLGHYLSTDQVHWNTTLDNVPQYPITTTLASQTNSITVDPVRQAHPYMSQWNFDIQHQIKNLLLDAAYVGDNAVHQPFWSMVYGVNINVIPVSLSPLAQGRFISPYVPYPQFPAGVNLPQSNGTNNYQSLQLKAEQRMSAGLNFIAAFTWSKMITVGQNPNGSEFGSPFRDPLNNWKLDRGPSLDNYPRRFSLGFSYDLPVGHGRQFASSTPKLVDAFIGGWMLSSIIVAQSGHSLTPNLSYDSCSCGVSGYPNFMHPLQNQNKLTNWFDTSAFAAPALYTIGNSGEGIFLGPGLFNINATLSKKFNIIERYQLEFRGEAYNLTNTPSFGDPNITYGTATFGQVTTTGPNYNPRYLQLALKLHF